MDMNARKQYLKVLQEKYFMAKSRKDKSSILDEYCRNTEQNRKYVIRKIRFSISPAPKKRVKKRIYDGYLRVALVKAWEIFDYMCGQRLAPMLNEEMVNRLREQKELHISDEVAEKLIKIAPATIDRALKHQREVLHLNRKYKRKINPLICQKIPVKAGGWDRSLIGQVQIDCVEHCGESACGQFVNSINSCEIASGWWEAEALLGRGQERSLNGITLMRKRAPFKWLGIHPDNDTTFINWHLVSYCEKEKIVFTRSRPYKKNDNSFVEQKNATHIRNVLGHLRYDTEEELEIINDLFRGELRLYKNFFQPVMKLKEKIRDKGKVHRKYDTPKTPYQRLIESEQIPDETKKKLNELYKTLNPAALKRKIDEKLNKLYKAYERKRGAQRSFPLKRQTPRLTKTHH